MDKWLPLKRVISPLFLLITLSCDSQIQINWKTETMPFYSSGLAQAFSSTYGLITFGGMGYPWEERSQIESLDQLITLDTPFDRAYTKGVVYQNHLYIAGGRQGMEARPTLLKINLDTLETIPLADMNLPRLSAAIGVFDDGRIIVGGGYTPSSLGTINRHTVTDTIETYNPHTNKWNTLTIRMPEGPVTHCAGFVHKNQFYTLGGFFPLDTGQSVAGNPLMREMKLGVWRLDGSKWTRISTLPIGLSGMGAAVWNDHIIILGGTYLADEPYVLHGLTFVYYYSDLQFSIDLYTGLAVKLEGKSPSAANDIQMTIVGDTIYVAGGEIMDANTSFKSNILQIGRLGFKR